MYVVLPSLRPVFFILLIHLETCIVLCIVVAYTLTLSQSPKYFLAWKQTCSGAVVKWQIRASVDAFIKDAFARRELLVTRGTCLGCAHNFCHCRG